MIKENERYLNSISLVDSLVADIHDRELVENKQQKAEALRKIFISIILGLQKLETSPTNCAKRIP